MGARVGDVAVESGAQEIAVEVLARVPLFAMLPPEELARLAHSLQPREVRAGAVFCHEGEIGDHLYIVLAGEIDVVKALGSEDERLLGRRGPGEFIGEMSLVSDDRRRTASLRAREPSRLALLTAHDFAALLARQPALAYEMVRVLGSRLDASHQEAIQDLHRKNEELRRAYDELRATQAQLVEKEALERELQVAHQIQMSLLPRRLPALAALSLGARLLPARAVGGDFFDFLPLGPHRLGIAIGDVTGKGVPAALLMAQVIALLRAEAPHAPHPAVALRRVNYQLRRLNVSGFFVTLIFGVLDSERAIFEYVRAGHEIPLRRAPDGAVSEVARGVGQPLGLFASPLLDHQTLRLAPGETLVLYTDGLTDARNTAGEAFGAARLAAVLRGAGAPSAQAMCDRLLAAALAHQDEASQSDDITLATVRVAA